MLEARVETCGPGFADLLGPQVRDSKRIYLTALHRPPPKTTVSRPNVTFHIRFNGSRRLYHCDLADGSTPILPHLLASESYIQSKGQTCAFEIYT